MTEIAPSAAPPNALTMWTDGRRIFIELPSTIGPVVLAFPLSTGGLSKALSILSEHKVEYAGAPYVPGRKLVGSANQHDSAHRALVKLGLIR